MIIFNTLETYNVVDHISKKNNMSKKEVYQYIFDKVDNCLKNNYSVSFFDGVMLEIDYFERDVYITFAH